MAAVDAKDGFLLQDLREAEFARAIIARADDTTVAADASKFGGKAAIAIAPLGMFKRFVTDAPPPPDIQEQLELAGITVQIA